MFHSSSQRMFWIFKEQNELKQIREKSNADYIAADRRQNIEEYLTVGEEKILVLHYEYQIKKFCGSFQPPITMPSVVVSLRFLNLKTKS
jgi:hypothetical protein